MSKDEKNTARFDARMTENQKRLLEEAARVKGYKNLSEYIVTTMVSDATQAIDAYKKVQYTLADKEKVMEVLSKPVELSLSFLSASDRRSKKLKNEVSDR